MYVLVPPLKNRSATKYRSGVPVGAPIRFAFASPPECSIVPRPPPRGHARPAACLLADEAARTLTLTRPHGVAVLREEKKALHGREGMSGVCGG